MFLVMNASRNMTVKRDISIVKQRISLFLVLRLFSESTHLVLCSGGPLPGHADVPGSNPGRTLYSKHNPQLPTTADSPAIKRF